MDAFSAGRLLGASADDPVVWERCMWRGNEFRSLYLSRSAREGLLKQFGESFLAEYIATKEWELECWAKGIR